MHLKTLLWEEVHRFLFFFLATLRGLLGILVPQLGIEPGARTVRAPSPNDWTSREFPHRFLQEFTTREFPASPVVGTLLSLLRAQIQSLIRELKSHKLCGEAKKKKELTTRWLRALPLEYSIYKRVYHTLCDEVLQIESVTTQLPFCQTGITFSSPIPSSGHSGLLLPSHLNKPLVLKLSILISVRTTIKYEHLAWPLSGP